MSDESSDVIVIGAGVAGLAAAHELGARGWRVLLLEARDRIGVGGSHAPDEFARSVADTLYFAGEWTSTEGHTDTAHGALQTGLRAARDVIEKGS